jgi:hypothetical protein
MASSLRHQSYPNSRPAERITTSGCGTFRTWLLELMMSVHWVMVLQNSQNALRSISRKLIKRAAIADRCRLQAISVVACAFIADYVVPQNDYSIAARTAEKLLLVDTKRLLQH